MTGLLIETEGTCVHLHDEYDAVDMLIDRGATSVVNLTFKDLEEGQVHLTLATQMGDDPVADNLVAQRAMLLLTGTHIRFQGPVVFHDLTDAEELASAAQS